MKALVMRIESARTWGELLEAGRAAFDLPVGRERCALVDVYGRAAERMRREGARGAGDGPLLSMRHGRNQTYNRGCRCDECRQAHTDYARARRASSRPAPPRLSDEERSLILEMHAVGHTIRAIAAATGRGHSPIGRIVKQPGVDRRRRAA